MKKSLLETLKERDPVLLAILENAYRVFGKSTGYRRDVRIVEG